MVELSTGLVVLEQRVHTLSRRLGLQRDYFNLREYARAQLADKLDLSSNRKHKAIFVHVPKCAGTTIFTQVPISHGHRSASLLRWKDPALFDECFKFAFVRNPYDRFVSAFHYLRSTKASRRDAAWSQQFLSEYKDFRVFAEALLNERNRNAVLSWLHFLPQTYFLCDRSNRVLVDFVGRTEHFVEDLDEVNRRSGLNLKNKRTRSVSHASYKVLYTAETARMVEQIYAEDFAQFGYAHEASFGETC